LSPNVDWRRRNVTSVHVLVASAFRVDLRLNHCGPDHSGARDEETSTHTLQGRKSNLCLTQKWIDNYVEDRNHNDDTQWVEVVDKIVGDSVELHGSGLGDKIVIDLVICQP